MTTPGTGLLLDRDTGIKILFRGAYYNIGMSMKYNTMLKNNTMIKKYNVKSHQIALWLHVNYCSL